MSSVFKPRLQILPADQKALWPQLKPAQNLGYVLYGGTAVALHLGHRESVDFDFFSAAPLDMAALKSALPFIDDARKILQQVTNTFSISMPPSSRGIPGVKLSFFNGINFGHVNPPAFTDDCVMQVASLDDLM